MQKFKKIILVALPPLLTVFFIFYGIKYYKNKKADEQTQEKQEQRKQINQENENKKYPTKDENKKQVIETIEQGESTENEEYFTPVTDDISEEEKTLSLDEAEENIIELAAPLSELSFWQLCLSQTKPIRRFVSAIDSIAMGERPLQAFDFMSASGEFSAKKEGLYWVQADKSKKRFAQAVEFFCKLSPEAAAKLYRLLEPALQEACYEMGYRDKTVRTLLTEACNTILSTPILEEEALLTPGGKDNIFYWQMKELEELNDAQKLFLRLGKENADQVRKQIEKIASELQLYEE